MSVRIDIPVIVHTFFLQHIQICVSRRSPSARKVALEVHCDDDRWSHLGSTRSRHGLQRHLWILSVETLTDHHKVLCWDLRSLRLVPASEWVLGNRSLFLTILLKKTCKWENEFVWSIFLSRHPNFPNLPDLLSEYLLSKFSPRPTHSQEGFLVIFSYQIDEFLLDLSVKSNDVQQMLEKVLLALWMVLQIFFHMEFSRLPRGLGHFADSNSIPSSQTTTFHPILIVAILLKYLLSCRCMQVLVYATAPKFLTNFSVSCEVFVYTKNSLSGKILYHNSVLVGDCLLIHIPHWGLCDPPWSSHQTFLLEVELLQCVFCKEPLSFWFSGRRRNSRLVEWVWTLCSQMLLKLSWDVLDLIPEKCVQMHAILCPPDFLWTPPTIRKDLPNGRPNSSCHPSFSFLLVFTRGQNWRTIQGQHEVRHFPYCR